MFSGLHVDPKGLLEMYSWYFLSSSVSKFYVPLNLFIMNFLNFPDFNCMI